ncbi:LppP/LprE family lipoprotein [Nocardia sp. PE-7]|uniref:LppP/LprE family lipoprotein n=1 Tax=Nocardia sp. PE-7 TaxID=3058426 RepID=UPI00265AEEA0|nr:LppP/LprE family lipoprotein [Nocardia sp. PE-7]WKG08162.1 LppP/LprE family lipoprotein [Nocardia sp. PE-7]
MKNAVRMGALIAVAAALVAGCTDESGSGATTSTSRATAASSTTRAPAPGTQAPGATAPEETAAPRPGATTEPEPETPPVTQAPTLIPAPDTTSPAPADDISGPGRCLDPASTGVQNALASLEGSWVAGQASTDQPGSCGQLLYVRAIGGNSAGAPIHILFFRNGKYLGTGTSEPYAFTTVVGSSNNAVTVDYRWLAGDEPFAAPQGGPATITYSWNGSKVVMGGTLPTEVTQPHR